MRSPPADGQRAYPSQPEYVRLGDYINIIPLPLCFRDTTLPVICVIKNVILGDRMIAVPKSRHQIPR